MGETNISGLTIYTLSLYFFGSGYLSHIFLGADKNIVFGFTHLQVKSLLQSVEQTGENEEALTDIPISLYHALEESV